MVSSVFYAKPNILNNNYEPIKNEDRSLQYYFKEAFILMDNGIQPAPLLASLLDKYVNFYKSKGTFGKMVQQQALAKKIKSALDNSSSTEGLKEAIQIINEKGESIKPEDDLMWLFSAYFSLFPFLFPELTNLYVRYALTICDMNNIYFHTILERWLAYRVEHNALSANRETIEIAFLTNQYQPFLRKMMDDLKHDDSRRSGKLLRNMDILVKYATLDQIENIILPSVMAYLNSDQDQSGVLAYSLPFLANKVSEVTLETKIVPELFKIFKQQYNFFSMSELLLICINRMSAESLRRCVLPVLTPYFFSESKDDVYDREKQYAALKLFLALLSNLNKEENDKISEQLIPRLDMHRPNKILSFLKNLRNKKLLYVNENLFQAISENVSQEIDLALADLKNHGYYPAYPKHLNAQQVKNYFSTISLEEAYKSNYKTFLTVLRKLTQLPEDIYPKSLRKAVLEFLWNHRNAQISSDEPFVSTLICYLKTHEFSGANSRKILIEVCRYAKQKIQEANFDSDLWGMHSKLLETCASLMTVQELKLYIVPMMDVNQIDNGNVRYLNVMHPIFRHVFTKVTDEDLCKSFFESFLTFYKSYPYSKECKEILALIIKKLDPVTQIYAGRRMLKSEISDFQLDNIVNIFAWTYQHNSESLHLPGFCTAHQHRSVGLSNRIEGRWAPPMAESMCSMM